MNLRPYPVEITDVDGATIIGVGYYDDNDELILQVGHVTRDDPHDYLAAQPTTLDPRVIAAQEAAAAQADEHPVLAQIRRANGL